MYDGCGLRVVVVVAGGAMGLKYAYIRYFSQQASETIGEDSPLAPDQIMLAHYWWPDRVLYGDGWGKHNRHIWNDDQSREGCIECLMVLQRCEQYKEQREHPATTD